MPLCTSFRSCCAMCNVLLHACCAMCNALLHCCMQCVTCCAMCNVLLHAPALLLLLHACYCCCMHLRCYSSRAQAHDLSTFALRRLTCLSLTHMQLTIEQRGQRGMKGIPSFLGSRASDEKDSEENKSSGSPNRSFADVWCVCLQQSCTSVGVFVASPPSTFPRIYFAF